MATSRRNLSPSAREDNNEARLAAIVDCSDDAILSKDLKGTILTWNKAAMRLLGYRANEIIGKSIVCLIPGDRLPEEQMILGKLRRGERVEHYETVRLHKNGRPVDVSISVAPLKDSRGRVWGASKIIRDLTGGSRKDGCGPSSKPQWTPSSRSMKKGRSNPPIRPPSGCSATPRPR
jgi:PAS domain S-box-containing protein